MIVRNLLNNTTVTAAGTMVIGGIGAGIYRPIRFEDTSAVTSIKVSYLRNDFDAIEATVVPYENAVIDLSSMAPAFPSYVEATKSAAAGFEDLIRIFYTEGGSNKVIMLPVFNVSAANGRFYNVAGTANLTDYADGNFNKLDFALSYNSPLTGVSFNNRIYYGQLIRTNTLYTRPIGGSTNTAIQNGTYWNVANPTNLQVMAQNGTSSWGYIRYATKYPYCGNVSRRVTLKWLNSYALYDSMYFDSFRVEPTYQLNVTGGNRILSYTVTVNTVVTPDNNKALYWLSRSQSVMGVFPIDTTQWAKVTIENPAAYNVQGGTLGRTVSFKCKFEIVEA
nr:MAG TPA: hypothetical protein [Caudoviricetes sp.]